MDVGVILDPRAVETIYESVELRGQRSQAIVLIGENFFFFFFSGVSA